MLCIYILAKSQKRYALGNHGSFIHLGFPLDVLLIVVNEAVEMVFVVHEVLPSYVVGNETILDLHIVHHIIVVVDIMRQYFDDLGVRSHLLLLSEFVA